MNMNDVRKSLADVLSVVKGWIQRRLHPVRPEDLYFVTVTKESVRVEHPKRGNQEIRWCDLEEIDFMTTDEGPFAPDLFLKLTGGGTSCVIPSGTAGYDAVFGIVSEYEGFDATASLLAMGSTENALFKVWERKPASAEGVRPAGTGQ
jgi:hypothetical protein